MTSPEKLTDSPTLLPCPFCGGAARYFKYSEDGADWHKVRCNACPALVEADDIETRDEAIAAWNRRTPIESSTEPVAWTNAFWLSQVGGHHPTMIETGMARSGTHDVPLYLAAPVSVAPAVTRPLTRGERQIEYLLLAMERSEGVTPFYGNTEPRPACFSEEEWTRLLLTSDAIMEHGWKDYVELHGVELETGAGK